MIAEKFVDLYARNSGIRDKLVAERERPNSCTPFTKIRAAGDA